MIVISSLAVIPGLDDIQLDLQTVQPELPFLPDLLPVSDDSNLFSGSNTWLGWSHLESLLGRYKNIYYKMAILDLAVKAFILKKKYY